MESAELKTWQPARLADLPPPPSGRTGWPWTWECRQLPNAVLSDAAWPKITLVTPSYNQVTYLEETVRSVLLQGYPNLEYIVMDGGSTDGSLAILERYAPYFDYWTSGKDGGQAPALLLGFGRSTGDIQGFVNSDDLLLPGALLAAGRFFREHPEAELVVGRSVVIDSASRVTYRVMGLTPTFNSLLFGSSGGFNQPATFWKRSAATATGYFDVNLRFSFDYDMYLRLTRRCKAHHLGKYLAAFRLHATSKTSTLQDVQKKDNVYLKQYYGIDRYPIGVRRAATAFYRIRYRWWAAWFKLRNWVLPAGADDPSAYLVGRS